MMKSFVLGTFLVVAVLASLTTAQFDGIWPDYQQSCTRSDQCSFGYCCLNPMMRRGKRQAVGICKPRKANGQRCYVNNDSLLPNHGSTLYYDSCPCQDGVPCAGTGQVVVPQGELGFCAAKTKETPCSSQNDCENDECCVSLNQPKGRKKRALTASGFNSAVCRKRGQAGDSCLVSVTVANDVNFACPCVSGLSCQGTGVIEIPLGERGICTEEPKETPCTSQKNCADDECCVSLNQPKGRKKRSLTVGDLNSAVCRKRGQAGDSCLVSVTVANDVNFACPCVSGLSCQGTGLFEIPLGERGVCTGRR